MQLAETGSRGLSPKSLPGGSQNGGHGGPQLGGDRSGVLDILHQSRLDDAMSGTRGKTYLNRAGRVEGHSGGCVAAEAAKTIYNTRWEKRIEGRERLQEAWRREASVR